MRSQWGRYNSPRYDGAYGISATRGILRFQSVSQPRAEFPSPASIVGATQDENRREDLMLWLWWGKQLGLSENVVYPKKTSGFADHYPYKKWLFHWGYTPFSDIPNSSFSITRPLPNGDFKWYHLVMTNITMENPKIFMEVSNAGKIIYFD